MVVSELIDLLKTMPQDATVISGGTDYPEAITGIRKITKKNFDGYYYPEYKSNPNVVIQI